MAQNSPVSLLEPAEEALVIRCQLGDRQAFAALLTRWLTPLHRFLWSVCGSRDGADELAQEVWLRVLRGLPTLRDAARFRAWLFGIAHRVLADVHSARHLSPDAAEDAAAAELRTDSEWQQDPAAAGRLDAQALAHGLSHLLLQEREVLTLFYLEGMSLAEVATVLAIPIGTVKSRLFRARSAMRALLAPASESMS